MTGRVGLSSPAVVAPTSSHFLAQSSWYTHTHMYVHTNDDQRSFCRILTHYAVQTLHLLDFPLILWSAPHTSSSPPCISSYRIHQGLRLIHFCVPFLNERILPSVFVFRHQRLVVFLDFSRFNAHLTRVFVQDLFRNARLFILFLDQHQRPSPLRSLCWQTDLRSDSPVHSLRRSAVHFNLMR